jgi:hypothetical protein
MKSSQFVAKIAPAFPLPDNMLATPTDLQWIS